MSFLSLFTHANNRAIRRTTGSWIVTLLTGSAVLLTVGTATAADTHTTSAGDQSIATVNGVPVPQSREQLALEQARVHGAADTPALRQAITENLISGELLVQAAEREKLDADPRVAQQIDMSRRTILIAAYQAKFLNDHPIDDRALHDAYDEMVAKSGTTEYHVQHILAANEAQAQAVITRLNQGANFTDVARESLDAGSKDHGGDLGWNSPNAYPQPFADAIRQLKKGQYTHKPVQTKFGWHVILLDETRPLVVPPFEQIKDKLRDALAKEAIGRQVAALRKTASVTVTPDTK